MNKIDWSKVLFRASSMGQLMTEPQEKAAKEKGELSKTAIAHLVKVYGWEKYGRKKDITTKQMDKGILAEEDSIDLFSRVEKKMFYKNKEKLTNEYFSGHPDIFEGDDIRHATSIHDIKSSWDMTFIIDILSCAALYN